VLPTETVDVVALAVYAPPKRAEGKPKEIPITIDMPVFIIRSSTFGIWLKGKVLQLLEVGSSYLMDLPTGLI